MTHPAAETAGDRSVEVPSTWVRRAAGALIALALGAAAVLYYSTEVCDQHLTQAGSVVTLCRKLVITDPPMAALGLIALVALTAFFSEISGFGFSLKREIRSSIKKSNEALSRASSAQHEAHSARQTSEIAQEAALNTTGSRRLSNAPSLGTQISHLISQYNTIRSQEKSSAARTNRLSTIASRMVSALSGAPLDAFPITDYMHSGDDGNRMAAYAYIYANPEIGLASALTNAILLERTRFGQYWAIRALGRVIAKGGYGLDSKSTQDLADLLSRLEPGSDRAYELGQLLSEIQP